MRYRGEKTIEIDVERIKISDIEKSLKQVSNRLPDGFDVEDTTRFFPGDGWKRDGEYLIREIH